MNPFSKISSWISTNIAEMPNKAKIISNHTAELVSIPNTLEISSTSRILWDLRWSWTPKDKNTNTSNSSMKSLIRGLVRSFWCCTDRSSLSWARNGWLTRLLPGSISEYPPVCLSSFTLREKCPRFESFCWVSREMWSQIQSFPKD